MPATLLWSLTKYDAAGRETHDLQFVLLLLADLINSTQDIIFLLNFVWKNQFPHLSRRRQTPVASSALGLISCSAHQAVTPLPLALNSVILVCSGHENPPLLNFTHRVVLEGDIGQVGAIWRLRIFSIFIGSMRFWLVHIIPLAGIRQNSGGTRYLCEGGAFPPELASHLSHKLKL